MRFAFVWDFIHCRMVCVQSQKSIEQATENSSAALVAISVKIMNVFHLK